MSLMFLKNHYLKFLNYLKYLRNHLFLMNLMFQLIQSLLYLNLLLR